MIRLLIVLILGVAVLFLSACSTLNEYGIGGPPALMCSKSAAYVDDKLAGTDAARLSVVRRFSDGDGLCK